MAFARCLAQLVEQLIRILVFSIAVRPTMNAIQGTAATRHRGKVTSWVKTWRVSNVMLRQDAVSLVRLETDVLRAKSNDQAKGETYA